MPWLVSACLLGHACRHDGATAKSAARDRARLRIVDEAVVAVCPEAAGGLSIPRRPARIVGGDGGDVLAGRARVIDDAGVDVTAQFVAGAQAAVAAARAHGVTHACLKARSPSCGRGRIHGEGGLVVGDGVAAAALVAAGVFVTTDEDAAG